MGSDVEKSNSTQNIPQEATKLKKLPKVTACYMEMQKNLKTQMPCRIFLLYLHIILKPSLCPVVINEGSDVYCSTSGVCNRPRPNILPMDPNKEKMC